MSFGVARWWIAVALALGASAASAADGLATLYQRALTQDQTYLAATAGARAARELRPQARAALLPNVNAATTLSANQVNVRESGSAFAALGRSDYNSSSLQLSVTQPLYRRDLWIALDQADRRVLQSDARFALAGQDLILRIAERYFGLLGSLDELNFSRAVRDAFGEQLKQAEQRFEVGLIAVTDVEEARSGFDLATANIIAADNQVDNAREALREVTGSFPAAVAPLGAAMTLAAPDPDDVETWTARALEHNLAVASARLEVDIASSEIHRVEAGHLPTFDLVGSHTRAHSGAPTGSRTWSSVLSLQLNVPIYQGGLVMSRTRQSRDLHRQALASLERERRSVERQTRDAFFNVKSGIAREQALAQAVRSTRSAADSIHAGFEVGTRTTVDVLDAQRAVFQARRDVLAARYDYILGMLRLKAAAGTLAAADIGLVDRWLDR